jgi:hypothetical protein
MTDNTPIDPGNLNRFYDEFAVEQLKAYFESGQFAGAHFESFGNSAETANRFTSDDIVAVSFVSSRIPGLAALQILETDNEELNELLSKIPGDVDLWDAPKSVMAADSPAAQLWDRLAAMPGMTRFAAGKLLARKRPRLFPVYDKVFYRALNRPPDAEWWHALRDVFVKNPSLLNLIEGAQHQAGIKDISPLRLLQVSVWMRSWGRPELAPDADT